MATLLTKKSDTASSVPLAADLTNAAGGAELAVNTADKRLYSKTSGGTVVELGTNPSSMTLPSATSQPSGTANGIPYLNASKVLTSGSALTFDGTTFSNTTNAALAKVAGAVGWLSVGDNNTGAGALRLFGGATQKGWQIGSNLTVANALEFSLATTAGGTTFTDQQMILTSTGLGIGTTSPLARLHVVGSPDATFNSHIIIGVGSSGSAQKLTFNPTLSSAIAGLSDGSLAFYGNGANTERARIDSGGNLLVGTTSAVTNGGAKIVVGTATYRDIGHATGTASGSVYDYFSYNNVAIGSITQNGTTGVLYNMVSDHRLKTVLGSVTDSGARIDALEPIEYEWKSDGSRTRGFLAHKFQEVYAGSVTGTKDAVDAEGKPVYQAMQASSSEVIADLVAEIKSLRKRLAAAGI